MFCQTPSKSTWIRSIPSVEMHVSHSKYFRPIIKKNIQEKICDNLNTCLAYTIHYVTFTLTQYESYIVYGNECILIWYSLSLSHNWMYVIFRLYNVCVFKTIAVSLLSPIIYSLIHMQILPFPVIWTSNCNLHMHVAIVGCHMCL